jgi:hypothetical protein
MRTVYIIGAPGSGKSTAVLKATELANWQTPTQILKPIAHLDYGSGRIQLGKVRPTGFSGTDALGMGVNPHAIAFIQTHPAKLILAEGDRLANRNFLTAAQHAGTLDIIWIDTPPDIARQRAKDRAHQLGTPEQKESWWKGRYTKTSRLAGGWPHTRLDGTLPPDTLAHAIAQLLI